MSTHAIAAIGVKRSQSGGDSEAATERALVSSVRAGSDRAFEALYESYHRRIASYVFGMVSDHGRAEDVTQEVFISALRRMRATDRPIAFKPWIYEIARNACIDSYRRSTTRAEEVSYDHDAGLPPADSRKLVAVGAAPDDVVESKQLLDLLCGAFTGLSEAHHEILVLRELEGLSYAEIGERMGVSRPAVESTLFRARKRLAEEYEELTSGRRCERVQAVVSSDAVNSLGARDRERLARHLSYCQPCRRHTHAMGHSDLETRKRSARSRLAALIPLPLLRPRGDQEATAAGQAAQPGLFAAHLSASVGALEPLAAGWTKAAATVVAIAAGGMGTGIATNGDPFAVVQKAVGLVAQGPDRPNVDSPSRTSGLGSLPAGALLHEPHRQASTRTRPLKAPAGATTATAGPPMAPASTAPSSPLPAADPQSVVKATPVPPAPASPKEMPAVSPDAAASAPQAPPPLVIPANTSATEPAVESTSTALRATVSVVSDQTGNVGGAAATTQAVGQAQ